MTLPRLNRRLLLEARERIADGSGGFDTTWQPLGMLWAQISARSGRDGSSLGAPVANAAYRIVVRAAPEGAPDRPLPGQRFADGNRRFHIDAVVEADADLRYLTCFATEEIAT